MTHFAPLDASRTRHNPLRAPTQPVELFAEGDDALTRMDMYCHSSASAGPVIHAASWVSAPECYSTPEEVYAQAITRGMDLVTLTDHDTIAGALSLVERGFPNVLLGQEVIVRFPKDRVKLHVFVYNFTPELDEEITTLALRENVYAFAE